MAREGDWTRPDSYAWRTVETALDAFIETALESGSIGSYTSGPVAILLGQPGNGIRSILESGIASRWGDVAVVLDRQWDEASPLQLCLSAEDVPHSAPPQRTLATAPVLIVACHDMTQLPAWVLETGERRLRIFPVETLSLVELHGFLEVRLGGPVELATARALGTAAGFVPATLAWLVREAQQSGTLARLAGTWQLVQDLVSHVVAPYVRARIATAPESATTAFRLALSGRATQADPEEELVLSWLREGVLERQATGEITFRAPAVAEALRRLSPAGLAATVHNADIAAGTATPQAIRWALETGQTVPDQLIDTAITEALHRHEWHQAATVAELAVELARRNDDENGAAATGRRCIELHIQAATAARFLSDGDRAHAHLDHAESLGAQQSVPDHDFFARISVVRAELLHFHHGDPDAALDVLANPLSSLDDSGQAGTDEAVDLDPNSQSLLLAHQLIHLSYAGRLSAAAQLQQTEGRALRRVPHELRLLVRLSRVLLLVAAGQPQQGLNEITAMAAHQADSAAQHSSTRGLWFSEEAKLTYVVAALGSDGPAAFPAIPGHLDDTTEGTYRPDLATFSLARAYWDYLCGAVSDAHQSGELALGASQHADPSGIAPALVGFLSETSALLGHNHRAEQLLGRFSALTTRSSETIIGGVEAHLAGARFALGKPDADGALGRAARRFIHDGRLGFASEALYAGVRFGRRRAARALCDIAGDLDGNLHGLRVSHAQALLAEDPVALLTAAERLREAGLRLYAAEAAARAARLPQAPASVRHRASGLIADLLRDQPLPGHTLLHGFPGSSSATELTPREQEVASLIFAGLSNAEIAGRLQLSKRTVEGHIARLYRKTGQDRRPQTRTRR